MNLEIDAIYENGLFRPLNNVPLGERVKVSLTVRQSEELENQSPSSVDIDFDTQLDNLLFNGPSLPADFSRADIYADHD